MTRLEAIAIMYWSLLWLTICGLIACGWPYLLAMLQAFGGLVKACLDGVRWRTRQ